MEANYDVCFAEMEEWEGWHKFSNNPRDPGGATWCGLTQRSYDAWRRSRGLPTRSVRTATDDELRTIFHDEYWVQARCDDLFPGLDLVQFDEAVNSGAVEATRLLQGALGVTQDGVFGLETLGKLQEVSDRAGLIKKVCAARLSWWRRLRTWIYFGVGWTRRDVGIEAKALSMLAALPR